MVTCCPPLSPSCWRTRACWGRVPWLWPTTCCSPELPSSWDTSAGAACTSGRSTGPCWSTAGASVTGWPSWSIRGSCRSCRGANGTPSPAAIHLSWTLLLVLEWQTFILDEKVISLYSETSSDSTVAPVRHPIKVNIPKEKVFQNVTAKLIKKRNAFSYFLSLIIRIGCLSV